MLGHLEGFKITQVLVIESRREKVAKQMGLSPLSWNGLKNFLVVQSFFRMLVGWISSRISMAITLRSPVNLHNAISRT